MLPDSDRERLRQRLVKDERVILHAYQDSEGWWTIGCGHLIDQRKGGSIPARFAMDLLDWDITDALIQLVTRFPWVAGIAPARQAALANMVFNLGIEGVAGFHNTMDAAKRGDWAAVKQGVLRSKYHLQTGQRAERVAEQLLTGEWP